MLENMDFLSYMFLVFLLTTRLYSFEVKDPQNEDPRSEGKKYCLLAFFFPIGIREHLLHPYVFEKIIRGKMTNFN
ncbi:MAG: hypothetical protein ACFFCQ_09120 [Promethearchaeota archaeon]